MGLFDDGGSDRASELMEEQIRENRAQLAAKAKSLYQTRLDIIRGQGSQSWEPNKNSPLPSKPRLGISEGVANFLNRSGH